MIRTFRKLTALVCLMGATSLAAGITDAVAHPDRSDDDRTRDATSKPAEVLMFLGLEEGMQVADLMAGGGYYSEIMARAVGDAGHVTAFNNTGYANFAGDAPKQRFDGRLDNVTYSVADAEAMGLPGGLDFVIMVMSFHDVYWVAPQQGWNKIDTAKFNAQIYDALKPGGVLAIVDHAALDGSGVDAVGTLHRIDEAFVVDELTGAGFELAASSDLLRNADDPRTALVFDPSIRRKTDRFLLKFVKPAG